MTVTVKFYHCANGDGLFDRLGSEPIMSVSVNLIVTVTETVYVNGPQVENVETISTRKTIFFQEVHRPHLVSKRTRRKWSISPSPHETPMNYWRRLLILELSASHCKYSNGIHFTSSLDKHNQHEQVGHLAYDQSCLSFTMSFITLNFTTWTTKGHSHYMSKVQFENLNI